MKLNLNLKRTHFPHFLNFIFKDIFMVNDIGEYRLRRVYETDPKKLESLFVISSISILMKKARNLFV